MTQNFARFAEDGRVVSAGHMARRHVEAEQAAAARIVALDEPITDLTRAFVIDGRVEYRDAPGLVESYADKRFRAYPPLAQFADALYWRERGDDAPWRAWLAACDAVKAQFPKEARK